MKVLVCSICVSVHSFPTDGTWRVCDCKAAAGRWVDPQRGTVEFAEQVAGAAYFIGLHNHFLMSAMPPAYVYQRTDEAWRALHDETTQAPGYLFDRERRNCWACVVRPGASSDSKLLAEWPEELQIKRTTYAS